MYGSAWRITLVFFSDQNQNGKYRLQSIIYTYFIQIKNTHNTCILFIVFQPNRELIGNIPTLERQKSDMLTSVQKHSKMFSKLYIRWTKMKSISAQKWHVSDEVASYIFQSPTKLIFLIYLIRKFWFWPKVSFTPFFLFGLGIMYVIRSTIARIIIKLR